LKAELKPKQCFQQREPVFAMENFHSDSKVQREIFAQPHDLGFLRYWSA